MNNNSPKIANYTEATLRGNITYIYCFTLKENDQYKGKNNVAMWWLCLATLHFLKKQCSRKECWDMVETVVLSA